MSVTVSISDFALHADVLCLQEKMFAAETRAVIKNVGAHTDLISNNNLSDKMDLLTLVKVSEGKFWSVTKYKPMHCTLPELIERDEEEDEFSPGESSDTSLHVCMSTF